MVEMHTTGDPRARAEVADVIEYLLSDRPGDGEFRLLALGKMTIGN